MKIYVNAELQKTAERTATIPPNAIDLVIGNRGGNDRTFNGTIDEVRMYPLALTEFEIEQDMRTQILQNKQHRWFYYFDTQNNWTTTPTDGVHGFTYNDPTLPYINRNATYRNVRLYRHDFFMGFQDFEINAVFEDTTSDATERFDLGFAFRLFFFKDGIWQARYTTYLYQGDAGANATSWVAKSEVATPNVGTYDEMYYRFNCSNTQDFTEWAFLVQAWTTEDETQLAIRIATKWNTTDGMGNYMYSHYYDLVDEDGNNVYLDWYDPYIVRRLDLTNPVETGTVRIKSHNWDITRSLIKFIEVLYTYLYYVPDVTPIQRISKSIMRHVMHAIEPSIPADPMFNVTNGIPNPLFDPLGYLGYQFKQLINGLSELLAEPLLAIGTTIMNALMSFARPIIETLTNVAIALWNFIVTGIDGLLYAIFPGLGSAAFSTFLTGVVDFLVGLFGWITTAFTHIVTFLTSTFDFLGAFIGKMLNTVSTAIGYWVTMIQNIFSMISGGLGTGTNIWETLRLDIWITIFAIFYPIYLFGMWETQGLDAVLKHLNMVANIFTWIGSIFLTVIQVFITIATTIIEALPGE